VKKIILLLVCVFPIYSCSYEESTGIECYHSYLKSGSGKSLKCALAYYDESVKNDNRDDDKLKLGDLYFLSGRKVKAVELYEQVRASSQSRDASYNLAQVYYSEGKSETNLSKVEMYLKEAADAGLAQAQLELSYLYSTYVKNKDFKKAVKYLTDAAKNKERNDDGYVSEAVIQAQFLLGKLYLDGIWGIEKNRDKATYWTKQASDNMANAEYGVKK